MRVPPYIHATFFQALRDAELAGDTEKPVPRASIRPFMVFSHQPRTYAPAIRTPVPNKRLSLRNEHVSWLTSGGSGCLVLRRSSTRSGPSCSVPRRTPDRCSSGCSQSGCRYAVRPQQRTRLGAGVLIYLDALENFNFLFSVALCVGSMRLYHPVSTSCRSLKLRAISRVYFGKRRLVAKFTPCVRFALLSPRSSHVTPPWRGRNGCVSRYVE